MENSLGQEALKFQKQCNKETLTLTLFNRPKEYGELSSQRVNFWVQKVEAGEHFMKQKCRITNQRFF